MPTMSPSREDIIHCAMIRAGLCAARGLPESQACHPPGCRVCGAVDAPDCEQCRPPVSPCVCRAGADVRHLPTDDTEGGLE